MKVIYAAFAFLSVSVPVQAFAQDELDLRPDSSYLSRPQTDEQRLETFVAPPPPPPSYPTINVGENGTPRLYITPDVSLGGSLSPLEGNVQFPIPGQ